MDVKYDSQIIETFATELYKKADSIVALSVFKFGLLAFLVGCAAGISTGVNGLVSGFIFAFAGGFFGMTYGQGKAFELRLEAQRALCFVQIEKNSKVQTLETQFAA